MSGPRPVRLVDSTLREGEQFARTHFTSKDRLEIARALDAFGVDYLEFTSPAASPRSAADLKRIARAGLAAKVVAHVRCHPQDVEAALACGVAGVHLLFGSSRWLREHGHGRDLSALLSEAEPVIRGARARGVEVRFSCEDAFRTPLSDLLRVCLAVEAMGAQRVGLADTVGVATPDDVARVVGIVRAAVSCDIEFHGHNDGGCAVANAFAAWRAGATHLDVTVLGIGERNGIAPLSGLVARLWLTDPALVEHYRLDRLPALDELVASKLGMEVPFNASITSRDAFTHKAGMHTNAVLREPRAYESIDPGAFGRGRALLSNHRLAGRNVLRHRAKSLGLALEGERLARAAAELKRKADEGPLPDAEVDALLRRHGEALTAGGAP